MITDVRIPGLSPFRTNDDWRGIVSQLTADGYNTVVSEVSRNGDVISRDISTNLITNGGRDFIAAQIGGAASAANVAKYMALSTDGNAPAAGDVALASEISANGLSRVAATYDHTLGAATFTQTATWSVTGTVNGIAKMGIFNQAAAGTLVFSSLLASAKSVGNGDTLTVVWTGTIGS